MIMKRQDPEPLAAKRQRPVGETVAPHRSGRLGAQHAPDRDSCCDPVRIALQITQLNDIGNHRMKPVNIDEFLGEIERRAEVMNTAIDVSAAIAEAEDAGPGGERGIPLGRFSCARSRQDGEALARARR